MEHSLSFFVSFIVVLFITPILIKYGTRKGIALSRIDERKIHNRPLPQLGGVSIFFAFIISSIIFIPLTEIFIGIIIASALILIIGLIDDLIELKAYIKLLFQIIVAILIVLFGVRVTHITNPFGEMLYIGFYGILFSIIWIVAIMNALNFIDGLDGLAAGITFISASVFFLVLLFQGKLNNICSFLALILAGATLAFLFYNFYPAKIFLGDNGSYFIGLILACISILGGLKSITIISFATPVLILGIPLIDTISSIIRRIIRGRSPFKPDKGHIHHQLLQFGLTHPQVVILIYIASIILGLVAIMLVSK